MVPLTAFRVPLRSYGLRKQKVCVERNRKSGREESGIVRRRLRTHYAAGLATTDVVTLFSGAPELMAPLLGSRTTCIPVTRFLLRWRDKTNERVCLRSITGTLDLTKKHLVSAPAELGTLCSALPGSRKHIDETQSHHSQMKLTNGTSDHLFRCLNY